MTVAWHCETRDSGRPLVAVYFYAGEHQNDWYDWGVRGTLIWPHFTWPHFT